MYTYIYILKDSFSVNSFILLLYYEYIKELFNYIKTRTDNMYSNLTKQKFQFNFKLKIRLPDVSTFKMTDQYK